MHVFRLHSICEILLFDVKNVNRSDLFTDSIGAVLSSHNFRPGSRGPVLFFFLLDLAVHEIIIRLQ